MLQQELDQTHARTKLRSVKELDGIEWMESHTLKGKLYNLSLQVGGYIWSAVPWQSLELNLSQRVTIFQKPPDRLA